jgi:ketosteroid isomerase-like protein
MKAVSSVLLVLALVPLSACAPKVNHPADVQAVKQTMEAYTKAIIAKDAPASVAMMTDKTAYFEPHMASMTGKDAVAKFHQVLFDNFDVEMTPVVTDVQVEGSLATMHGTFTNKLIPKAAGAAAMPDSGNWTVAARRQADGSWKWDWIMGASDRPMPGTTADGAEEQALMQIERAVTDAVVKRDIPALETYLGKEWMPTNDGQVTSRAQVLGELKSGAYKVESDAIRDLSVHVFGDVAVATMILDTKGTYKGADFSGAFRSTDFFAKRDGRWQIVSSQNTTIKP